MWFNHLRWRSALALALVLPALAMAPASPAMADDYDIGIGPLQAVKAAAESNLGSNPNCGLTKNKLTALMTSIPYWELLGGDRTVAPSPMTLSRYDTWDLQSANHSLFSDGTFSGYKRAHWNPGVGLWQLDTFGPTLQLNHWRRIAPATGGGYIADYLREGWCNGTSSVKSRLNGTWFACQTDKCWNTFQEIYKASDDSLVLNRRQGMTSWNGGLTTHSCRYGSGSGFDCGYVNVNNIEGYALVGTPSGSSSTSGITPLAKPFMSFNRSGTKRAIWLEASTGWNTEYTRTADVDVNARYSGNWGHSTDLQVRRCSGTYCYWSYLGLDP